MCIYRTEDGKCKKFSDDKTTSYCVNAPCEHEKVSNYDRIQNMNIDETAEFLMYWFMRCMMGEAPLNVKEWLESEVG
jgi:hypothetical protein